MVNERLEHTPNGRQLAAASGWLGQPSQASQRRRGPTPLGLQAPLVDAL